MTLLYEIDGITPGAATGRSVDVGGFKHAMVSVIAGCIARRRAMALRNAPPIQDTEVLCDLVERLGGAAGRDGPVLQVDCSGICQSEVPAALASQIHGSIYLLPALLVALGEVRFKEAGGCAIGDGPSGARPVQHILDVLGRFGADFRERSGWLEGRARTLRHAEVDVMDYSESETVLTGPLVSGATKTALLAMAGVHTPGRSLLRNPYRKPDVTQLIEFAQRCGDSFSAQGGVIAFETRGSEARRGAVEIELVSDLSEIMTFIAFSVLAHVPVTLRSINTWRVREGLCAELELLSRMGVPLSWSNGVLEVTPVARLASVDIEVTSTGIFSDHQPFFALMLLHGDRPATIRETVWKSRFSYVDALRKMGARIERADAEILVHPSVLHASPEVLDAADLRAAAALVLAASTVPGRSVLRGLEHLRRGYGGLLAALAPFGVESRPANSSC